MPRTEVSSPLSLLASFVLLDTSLHTISMNWAWMYLLLGTLLRRYNLVLHDTTERNVEMTRDNFIGQTDFGMNNIQVKVLGEYQEGSLSRGCPIEKPGILA